jgi:carbon storage regulator CsrA
MLVLSRKIDQEILINGNIKISVLKIKGNVVRIGIEAPDEVSIKRGELQIQEVDFPRIADSDLCNCNQLNATVGNSLVSEVVVPATGAVCCR